MLYRYYLHIKLLMSIKPVPRRSEDVPFVTDCSNWLHFFSLERTLGKLTRFNNKKTYTFLHFIYWFMKFVYNMIVNNVNVNQRTIVFTNRA